MAIVYFYDQVNYKTQPLALERHHVISYTPVADARSIILATVHGEKLLSFHKDDAFKDATEAVNKMMSE